MVKCHFSSAPETVIKMGHTKTIYTQVQRTEIKQSMFVIKMELK